MTIRFSQKVTLSQAALSQEVSGETVILDLGSESYFGLNEAGTRIWQLLQEGKGLQQVFDTMLAEFEVEPEQLERDITALLEELVQAELATVDD